MKMNCFIRQVKMDIMRSIFSVRFVLFVLLFAIILSASETERFISAISQQGTDTVMQVIFHNLVMDKFKIIMVILLSCIYLLLLFYPENHFLFHKYLLITHYQLLYFLI